MSARTNFLVLSGTIIALVQAAAHAQPWAQTASPYTNWSAVSLSPDGARLIAAGATACTLALSVNFGTNWTLTQTDAPIAAVCASRDGQLMYAGDSSGRILVSTNSGFSWIVSLALRDPIDCVSCSAKGDTVCVGGTGLTYQRITGPIG